MATISRRTYPEWDFQVVKDLGEINHNGGPSIRPHSTPRPLGPGLARWLLLAALALLLTEVVLAWQFGHYSGVPTNEPPPAPNRWLPALAVDPGRAYPPDPDWSIASGVQHGGTF